MRSTEGDTWAKSASQLDGEALAVTVGTGVGLADGALGVGVRFPLLVPAGAAEPHPASATATSAIIPHRSLIRITPLPLSLAMVGIP